MSEKKSKGKKEKKYCGNKDILPDGYTRFGSRYECMRTGVGVGLFIEQKKKDEVELRADLKNVAHRLGIKGTTGLSNKDIVKKISKAMEKKIDKKSPGRFQNV